MFIKYLVNYIKFAVSQINPSEKNETSYTLSNFSEKYGKELYKLFNEMKMKNVWTLQTLNYIRTFKQLKFDLSNHKEIVELANEIKNLCSNSTAGLIFLSSYFVKCCLKMERSGMAPSKINEILKAEVSKIKEMFSPKNKLEDEMKYLKRTF